MKVLIAEDDIISCRALAGNIAEWGYDVVATKNGEEAWSTLLEEGRSGNNGDKIRMAVLDWEMPKINGIELCRKIRGQLMEQERDYIYIILLTGRDHQEDIIKGLSAGADDYVTKPYDFIELKVRLKNGERIIDVESQRHLRETMDSLTRLWNRTKILEFLEDEIARNRRQNQPTAVILADIEGLKEINRIRGDSTGDFILTETASRLKKCIRRYDRIGRYGEDEFVIVFPNCRKDHLDCISERLRRHVNSNSYVTENGSIDIDVAWGGASSERFLDCTGDGLIKAAEKALISAKKQGSNQCVILEPEEET